MKPNILLITLDAVRPDRLRLYGGPVEMPNLEALAARGVTFTNAWAQAPNTWTSHASVFTGLWPFHHGLLDMGCKLDPAVPTLAEIFRDAGYATAGWPACVAAGSKFGLDRGFKVFREEYLFGLGEWGAGFVDFDKTIYFFSEFLDHAKSIEEPFFTWLHYFDVHHMPDEVWKERQPPADTKAQCYGNYYGQWRKDQFYDAKVAHADHYLGKILDLVDLSNTVVVIFSDHGEDLSLERHPFPCHETLSDEELKVVLVVSLPDRIVGDHKDYRRVRLIDVAPTLAGRYGDASGDCEAANNMDGWDVFLGDPVPRMVLAIDDKKNIRYKAHRYGRDREDDKVKKQLAGLGYIEGDGDA